MFKSLCKFVAIATIALGVTHGPLLLTACESGKSASEPPPKRPVFDPPSTKDLVEAAKEPTLTVLWPFMLCGSLGMAAGLAGLFFGIPRARTILIAGAVIAGLPAALFWFGTPMLVPIYWTSAGLGLLLFVYVGYRVFDYIRTDIREDRAKGHYYKYPIRLRVRDQVWKRSCEKEGEKQ